ncbi:hypothetical protein [Mesorhizobium sp. KR1-2]|uniref:hypothetical protein n=1 Tax=Mesorhizobium sp. KR1-2 TaxID=3156609 RepID=UPI0032B5CE6E
MSTGKYVLALGVAVGAITQAAAQSATNEAWIGQTGDTNTITIHQAGNGNSVGADNRKLRLNQDGRFNNITVKQTGWSNSAGATVPAQSNVASGINQQGDRNEIDLTQENLDATRSNVIAAILQISRKRLSELANALRVVQNGGHSIGWVMQENTSDGLRQNTASLLQSGGLAGHGNTIGSVLQKGEGNIIETTQAQAANRIGGLRQQGSGNEITVLQDTGEDNKLERVAQVGELNKATISQSGYRNNVAWVFQNNERVAIAGNTLAVTLAGDDNGGDGRGGVGFFTNDVSLRVGAYQSAFTQIGDDNAISMTVNGGSENLFGFYQVGSGNGAVVSISPEAGPNPSRAARNEVAIMQRGDDNNTRVGMAGNENVAGINMNGPRNQLSLTQKGNSNVSDIDIQGSDNNRVAAPALIFVAPLQELVVASDLLPGNGLQSGNGNGAKIGLKGNNNLFAFAQTGEGNKFSLSVSGSMNQVVSVQSGNQNASMVTQTGIGNSLAIHQF